MLRKEKIFLIDIDGVACDHAKAICSAVNEDYGINSKESDVTEYNYDFGPITFNEAVEKYYPDSNFIKDMEVTKGFHEFLDFLKEKMIVKFASARKYSHAATRLWIKRHFGDNFDILFVTKKADTEFNYLIDDYPPEVLAAGNKGKIGFLLCRPWNNNKKTKEKLKDLPNAFL